MAAIGLTLGLVMMTAPLWLPRLSGGAAPTPFAAAPATRAMPGTPVGDGYAGVLRALAQAQGTAGVPQGMVGMPPGGAPSPDDVLRMMSDICRNIAAGGQMGESECRRNLAAATTPSDLARALPQIATKRRSGKAPDAKFVRVDR
ncbi:MAG: hypothetical protein KF887_15605 [Paracoccaceae bacterium]|nr:MAG: hypothetical protein KF887_15605 [Paracoccaceae bacterium]